MNRNQLIALLSSAGEGGYIVDVRVETPEGIFDLEITGIAEVDANDTYPAKCGVPGWVTLEAESLPMAIRTNAETGEDNGH